MDYKALYLSFDGRISRSTFWLKGFLPIFVVNLVVSVVLGLIGLDILAYIVSLVLIWPMLAITAKRWHDRDKSGLWNLLYLVVCIGWIWSLVECGFLKGSDGDNKFGSDPVVA